MHMRTYPNGSFPAMKWMGEVMRPCHVRLLVSGLLAGTMGTGVMAMNVEDAWRLTESTLALVEKHQKRPALAARLHAMKGQQKPNDQAVKDLLGLRREIIFSHPLLDFEDMLINKRPTYGFNHMVDQYLGRHSKPGPGLCVIRKWKTDPQPVLILEGKLPEGEVLHPDISYDGKTVLFSFCDHREKNSELRRFWIYEAAVDGSWVKQLTGTRQDPLLGCEGRQTVLIEDWDPCYLPDGGFAFVSTRSQSYGRCHGGRYTPAYMLYRADAGGSHIRQLSFGEANEWDPAVLNDGRIIYTRWDYINRHDTMFQGLWTTHPDGTATAHFYGSYTWNPCMTAQARAIPGSSKVLSTAMGHHGPSLGTIVMVDPAQGHDGAKPLTKVTPDQEFIEIKKPGEGGYDAMDAARWPAKYSGGATGAGRYTSPCPIDEDLFLVSAQGAIYLCDSTGGRELIYKDPDNLCWAPFPIQERYKPPVIASTLPETPPADNTGTCFVRNVSISTADLPPGSIKYLRVNRIFNQPTRMKTGGGTENEVIKQAIGVVPVEDDGSVMFKVPAGTALQLQALDKDKMAVMTMRSFIYLHAGENQSCVGCHDDRTASPVVLPACRNATLRNLTPPPGMNYKGGFSFDRTVQPVFDRYCIGCHAFDPKNKIQLKHGSAYGCLAKRGSTLVSLAWRFQETAVSKPDDYFAKAGKLGPMLLDGHPDADGRKRVQLDAESWERIVTWLDLNCQQYGDYSFNRIEQRRILAGKEQELRQYLLEILPDLANQNARDFLVNVANPDESRVLMAPLAVEAGGWGQIQGADGKARFASVENPQYRKLRELVLACIEPLPVEDYLGTCNMPDNCKCGNCWVRKANSEYRQQSEVK